MKNQWTSYLFGTVRVMISGRGTERFLNDCIRKRIIVWNVKKKGEVVTFFIRIKDVHALREVARKNECKCRFGRRLGLPFLMKRSLRNSGFVIGIISFLFIIFALSNMVWGVKIEGAKPETEHQIKKELNRIGINVGKFQPFAPNPDKIQKEITDNIKDITWIGVELKGTIYHLKVVEKNQPETEKYISPRNIVAKKKAIISKMFVEQGEPVVFVNEYVNKGQLLVSGLIGKEDEKEEVAAKAEIYGETWYRSTVTVPLETSFNVFSGEAKNKHFIRFWSFDLPVWGFSKEMYSSYEVEDDDRKLKFLNYTLPISYHKEIYREKENVKRNYTVEQARKAGIEMGKKEIEKKLGEDGEVKGEKVLHETNEFGKVKLNILYRVTEDIVQTTPIVQGD
ncbi:sporulation protein YqfD [Metabacillus fastidiosus]|uniref:sporulation protein YqfD n=1 Tax=Metabacillus fastidiosus TaxID=1458 RepID=UPI002DB72DEA|nr:sporulation protein YqfD [Metabacillus fastidiosus]MEC2076516.1 sporulation protein YqfD [Metabacillus fastidiosus]